MKFDRMLQLRDYSQQIVVPAFAKWGFRERAEKLSNCGKFRRTKVCNNCQTIYFDGFDACNDRFCPLCQKKKSLKYISKLMPLLIHYMNNGYYIQLMNFTIKDIDNLDIGLKILQDSFRYLTHDNKSTAKEFKKRFVGGLKCLEVKIGENSKKWHMHLHCIVLKKEYSNDFEFLKNAWKESTKNFNYVGSVWLHGISSKKDLLSGVVESIKYITKFTLDVYDRLPELITSLTSKRAVSTWGLLHNLKSDENIDDDYQKIVKDICLVCGSEQFTKGWTQSSELFEFDSNIRLDLDNEIQNFKVDDEYEQILFKDLEEYGI